MLHSLRFPYQNLVCTSPLPLMCYMPHTSHYYWFFVLNNIPRGVKIIKLHCTISSSFLLPCRPKYLLLYPILEHPEPIFGHLETVQVSHPCMMIKLQFYIVWSLCSQRANRQTKLSGLKLAGIPWIQSVLHLIQFWFVSIPKSLNSVIF